MLAIEKDKVFGVMEASASGIRGMEPRYKAECGKAGEADYSKCQVMRDEDGNYFMVAKGGADTKFGFGNLYHLGEREVCIPITPEALSIWAEIYLAGEELSRAMEEFRYVPAIFEFRKIWQYQQGSEKSQPSYVYEFLLETDSGLYMLFSTDDSYPCYVRSEPWIELSVDGTGNSRDDLYLYYITPEVARRWAEARGMDKHTYQEVFEN